MNKSETKLKNLRDTSGKTSFEEKIGNHLRIKKKEKNSENATRKKTKKSFIWLACLNPQIVNLRKSEFSASIASYLLLVQLLA